MVAASLSAPTALSVWLLLLTLLLLLLLLLTQLALLALLLLLLLLLTANRVCPSRSASSRSYHDADCSLFILSVLNWHTWSGDVHNDVYSINSRLRQQVASALPSLVRVKS